MNALDDVIESFSRLPGIGKKSATRIAHFLLRQDAAFCARIAEDIAVLHEKIRPCKVCGAYTEGDVCEICANPMRNRKTLCIVEQPQDVQTIEATHEYNGLFHVLGGVIAPLEGIGPEQLNLQRIPERVRDEGITEIILATNPTVEGDTTVLYIQKLLKPYDIAITRLASGLPVGGDLEYADKLTLARSIRGRVPF